MTKLEIKILQLDKLYRLGIPEVSDVVFDGLFDTLPATSVLRTKGIISEVSSDRKEKLHVPMYSMDKLKSISEVKKWLFGSTRNSD